MTLLERLQQVTTLLQQRGCTFAVAGGIVASIYRTTERATRDLDLLLLASRDSSAVAKDILRSLGLEPAEVRAHELSRKPAMNKRGQPVVLVVGRSTKDPSAIGVDFLLPPFSWFSAALERAQHHQLDFGFARLPAITIEDMLIAKAVAGRPKDVDDINSIFESGADLDLGYLCQRLSELQIKLPGEVLRNAPQAVRAASRAIRGRR